MSKEVLPLILPSILSKVQLKPHKSIQNLQIQWLTLDFKNSKRL
jgi:hypothetical protein